MHIPIITPRYIINMYYYTWFQRKPKKSWHLYHTSYTSFTVVSVCSAPANESRPSQSVLMRFATRASTISSLSNRILNHPSQRRHGKTFPFLRANLSRATNSPWVLFTSRTKQQPKTINPHRNSSLNQPQSRHRSPHHPHVSESWDEGALARAPPPHGIQPLSTRTLQHSCARRHRAFLQVPCEKRRACNGRVQPYHN